MDKDKRMQKLVFWLFLIPALGSFAMVQIIPFVIGLYYSFTDWSATAQPVISFVGLKNYSDAFKDITFLYSTIITTIYTVANIILVNIVSFALALLVTTQIKGRNFYRAGFFLPNVIGGIILGYIWQFIFNQFIPRVSSLWGITYLADNLMLADSRTALLALVIVSTWQYAGYIMMIYVAALQNVPRDLIEAAQIDGASPWQRFKTITIPMVRPAFTITLFLTLVNSFKQFDVNTSLTGVGPSTMFMGRAINGTTLLAMNISNTSLVLRNTAMAQAKAIIFFVVLVVFSLLQVYFSKRKEVEL
ncbi:MAG TPA: ABC transporter permease [Erysipelotrichaceae bacterium]|nr:ABC transporter permease [Erysipelotrichaceae bacterium]